MNLKKRLYHKIFGIVLFTGLIFVSSCDKKSIQETGFLEGKITIGPICPVERIPPDPGCLPTAETYKAYPVSIWTLEGDLKIALINPALDGSFYTELPPGKFLVKLEKNQNGPGGSNLPVEVTITSRNVTLINIDIDTGIR